MKKITLIISLLIFIGCSKDGDKVQSTNLIINFTHTVAGEDLVMYPFGCLDGGECIAGHTCCMGGLNYTNAAEEQYNIETSQTQSYIVLRQRLYNLNLPYSKCDQLYILHHLNIQKGT
jgi:hypothetical protein